MRKRIKTITRCGTSNNLKANRMKNSDHRVVKKVVVGSLGHTEISREFKKVK